MSKKRYTLGQAGAAGLTDILNSDTTDGALQGTLVDGTSPL